MPVRPGTTRGLRLERESPTRSRPSANLRGHVRGHSMISKRFPFAVLAVLLLALFLPAAAYASQGAVHVFVGQKFLDEEDWEPIDSQFELGIDAALGGDDWPIWINLGLFSANGEEELNAVEEVEATTTEFSLGINKTWTRQQFRPFLAGGLAFVNTDVEFRDPDDVIEDDDSGVGLYA